MYLLREKSIHAISILLSRSVLQVKMHELTPVSADSLKPTRRDNRTAWNFMNQTQTTHLRKLYKKKEKKRKNKIGTALQ